MQSTYLKFAVIPGLILLAVSVVRARLEISDPDGAFTHAMSANYPTVVILLTWPVLLMRKGLALRQYLGVMAATIFLIRFPIAVIYSMAVAQSWTVEGTEEPVRYVVQNTSKAGEVAGAVRVFAETLLAPTVSGVIASCLLWSIIWAIGFRGKRPFAAASASVA